jgi:hypothetical protein
MPKTVIQWIHRLPIDAGVTVDVVEGGYTVGAALQNTFLDVSRHPLFSFSLYCDVPCQLVLNGAFQAVAPVNPFVVVIFGAGVIIHTPQLPAPFNLAPWIVVPYPLLNIQLTIPGIVNAAIVRFYGVAFD